MGEGFVVMTPEGEPLFVPPDPSEEKDDEDTSARESAQEFARYFGRVWGSLNALFVVPDLTPAQIGQIREVVRNGFDEGLEDVQAVATSVAEAIPLESKLGALGGLLGGDEEDGVAEQAQLAALRQQELAGLVPLTAYEAAGLPPEEARKAFMRQPAFGGAFDGAATRGPTPEELAIAQQQADAQSLIAQTGQTTGLAGILYQQGILALQQGDNELAQQMFEAAQQAVPFEQELASRQTGTLEQGAVTDAFTALENAIQGRGAVGVGAGGAFGNLADIVGNLEARQQELGLEILRTPRNAIASFLLGQGAAGVEGAEAFAPQNILGIEPGQFSDLIQQAVGSLQSAQAFAEQPPAFDLQAELASTREAALAAPGTAGEGADVEAARLPDTTTPSVTGLGNGFFHNLNDGKVYKVNEAGFPSVAFDSVKAYTDSLVQDVEALIAPTAPTLPGPAPAPQAPVAPTPEPTFDLGIPPGATDVVPGVSPAELARRAQAIAQMQGLPEMDQGGIANQPVEVHDNEMVTPLPGGGFVVTPMGDKKPKKSAQDGGVFPSQQNAQQDTTGIIQESLATGQFTGAQRAALQQHLAGQQAGSTPEGQAQQVIQQAIGSGQFSGAQQGALQQAIGAPVTSQTAPTGGFGGFGGATGNFGFPIGPVPGGDALQFLLSLGMPEIDAFNLLQQGQGVQPTDIGRSSQILGNFPIPSPQTLRRLGPSGSEFLTGLFETVLGIPQADLVFGALQPFQGLQAGSRARSRGL